MTLYETQVDRDRELAVLARYAAAERLTFDLAERNGPYDATMYRSGRPVQVVEIKYRNISRHDHRTYHIDKQKVDKLLSLAANAGASAVLVVSWQGEVGWINLSHYVRSGRVTFPVGVTKRRDRVEQADTVYHIPILGFTLLQRGNR